jgi:hypothetical protein
MGIARFEENNNSGTVHITTYFNSQYSVDVVKDNNELTFKMGGTGVNEVAIFEAIILEYLDKDKCKFRAFKNDYDYFEGIAELSPEEWNNGDMHCYILEYYSLDIEGNQASWIACKNSPKKLDCIFINLDIVDKENKVCKRYRCSPFFSKYKIINFE